mgnify:CR=1 FL=1
MRILLINTTEKIGGPAVAASRLMEALKNNGIKAKLLVRDKQTEQIPQPAHGMEIRMGTNRYLEGQSLQ